MPRRQGVTRTVTVPAEGDRTPARPNTKIIAEIRVHFPPNVSHTAVARAVLAATTQVLDELEDDGGWLMLAPLPPAPAA